MKTIHFKFGTWGLVDVVFASHSGQDWNKRIAMDQLTYWIQYYNDNGYNVIFKHTEQYEKQY